MLVGENHFSKMGKLENNHFLTKKRTYVNPDVSGTKAPNPKNGGMEIARV
jgi:hypothetical protein